MQAAPTVMAAMLVQVAGATATWRAHPFSPHSVYMKDPSLLPLPTSSPFHSLSWRSSDLRLRGGGVPSLSSQASRFAKFYSEDGLTDLPMNASFAMGSGSGDEYQEQDSACEGELNAWEVGKLQLEACQDIMDDCYDRWIRPCVEELENRIFEGEEEAARKGEFRPYNFFAKEATSIIQKCKIVIDKAVKDLQTRLEVIQFSAVRGGQPVSSIEFEDFNVDLKHVRHLTVESHRELHATTDRNMDRLWQQQKAVIKDYYVEMFERGIENLIAGSRQFNKTSSKLAKKIYKQCEHELKLSVPKNGKPSFWNYTQDLDDMKEAMMALIQARRREAGLDDLVSYFSELVELDDGQRMFSRKWWKNLLIRGVITYFQICQSAWAYRKARRIMLPPRFSKAWMAAVFLPWTFSPVTLGDVRPLVPEVVETAAAERRENTGGDGEGQDETHEAAAQAQHEKPEDGKERATEVREKEKQVEEKAAAGEGKEHKDADHGGSTEQEIE
ncbi:hypothetical protein GUITHDRAFT_137506 [Guillardia theta CCMP2712]|uniref:SPX domain-containing protein n=1 Tax=Guillardia theta (strain CCMP2712) TaxID=905079 RepID=L1JG92_GUITC|nr:hypothetical protein GUITHDRAFT_137506 [Guillardia theta CCMP2712]EKX47322.1 hypothetical protein GUITHDRAFT_137506 [Guillardia theta CCMP2712]|eukprot:XP_005834302.1 hypothetical protein GUITHDRAFT_137506 [Guillardia theta CCMP2712]